MSIPSEPHGRPPIDGLASFQSIKVVRAGEITQVVKAGCYVQNADGTAVLRTFIDGMTARYVPVVGDFWVVYDSSHESISPRQPFLDGYVGTATV